MGCVVCQTRSAIGGRDERTLNALTSLKIGDTSGFARYCGIQPLANGVQRVGDDGVEKILVLGRSMQDDGTRWHCWDRQRYQASLS